MSDPAIDTLGQLDQSGEDAAAQELTDGFHLVIDALKLNEIKLLLETLERKMRALILKRQAEEFEEKVPSWSSWHMSC